MRILFSLTYYTPYISGLTLYVKRLAEALVKKGYQLSVVSNQHETTLKKEEIINQVKVVRAKPLFKISKGFISLDWIIKNFAEVKKNDCVIINLPQFEGVVSTLLAKLFAKKVISVYHCEVILPQGISNKIVEFILNLSNFITLFFSNTIITYTRDFADHSRILPLFKKKLQYVYPPIIKPKVDKRVQNIIRKKIGAADVVIGVAARLAAEKGIEYLFEAIPIIELRIKNYELRIKNAKTLKTIKTHRECAKHSHGVEGFKLVIAGSMDPVGEKSYKEKILRLVEKYKDYIVFLGELKEEEMGSFYSLLDVLVLPSINSTEAFGMVQVEAMMTGVPVVATNLPGVRVPIQRTGMGVTVPIKNSQKLAEAIIGVILSKEKYTKNKDFIQKEFAFEKMIEFYERLLS